MRWNDPDFTDEAAGTTYGDALVGTVWRGDADPVELEITAWNLGWDSTRTEQGQVTLTIADPDGLLAPWGYGDLIAPGGSLINLGWLQGSTGIRRPLGRWRITDVDPYEQWRVHPGSVQLVPGGGWLTVQATELTHAAVLDRLDAVPGPTQATCMAEVEHLLDGIMAVTWDPAITDRPVPALAYGEDRMDAVQLVLDVLGAVHRMAPDGSLEVLIPGTDPVWTIRGGDGGVLVDVARKLSDSGLFNAIRGTSQTDAGAPIAERAIQTGGPLAFDGPFGRVTGFYSSTATTSAGVLADATRVLAEQSTLPDVVLPVECVTNASIQPHDLVVVVPPTIAGEQPLTGRVRTMDMTSAGSGTGVTPAKRMSLGVAVTAADLEAIAWTVARARR